MDSVLEEKINRYIHNKMLQNEKDDFEREMDVNQSLRSDVEFLIELKEQINNNKQWETKKRVLKLIKEQSKPNKIVVNSRIKWIGIAASILIIASLYYFFNQDHKYSISSLEVASISTQVNFMFPSGSRGQEDIYKLLEQQDLDEFLKEAEEEFKSNKDDEKLNYTLIHTLLFQNKVKEASQVYQMIPNEMKEKDEFKYLEAFIELNNGPKERLTALSTFQKLNNSFPDNHPLKANIKEIVNKLSK